MLDTPQHCNPPDDALIGQYRQGDAEAFNLLFERHYAGVYNFARHLLGDEHQAEEILQDTFLAVARTARTYQPRGLFRTWLMRIVRNRCLNRLQSNRTAHAAAGGLGEGDPPSRANGPAKDVETAEHMARVHVLIDALPQRQREALVLYAMEQMSYAQIAQVLDIPVNSVKTLIFRARAELARALEEETP